ncbi:universal stress protein [Haliangium sp.]|uniref:universal stress protein n=1 Tax=Haliangium sp. TaxID=2663208 RepID=UPI003D0F5337
MTETAEHPYVIVAAVDLSSISEAVFEHALDTAGRHPRVDVHVLSVVPVSTGLLRRPPSDDDGPALEEAEAALRERLAETAGAFMRSTGNADQWQLFVHVRAGQPAEEIAALTDEVEADLLVMGRHGWGGRRRAFVGSVSERALRLVHCSALVVQPSAHEARAAATEPACPACVAERRDSGGERWFCQRHHDDRQGRALSSRLPWSALSSRPGGLY